VRRIHEGGLFYAALVWDPSDQTIDVPRKARIRIRCMQLRQAATPFDRMPWEIQGFITDFLRYHGCAVTVRNQQVIAAAIEARVQRGPVCHAYLNALLEEVIVFE
jgi:hypothetical protein